MNKFLELKVDESIVSKLEEIGITEPTEVQKKNNSAYFRRKKYNVPK